MTAPQCFHMSATAIAAFKACPMRFRLGYREGLRLVEDTDSQRVGTNWHAIHEVYQNAVASYYRAASPEELEGEGAEHAAGFAHDAGMTAVIEHLDRFYAETPCPSSKSPEEWDCERQILLTSFIGYLWHWADDPVEPIASEVEFNLPLHAPRTGLPLPVTEAVRVGKIDHVVCWRNRICNVERKSTSKSIDPASDYWDRARKDTQVSMYALAFADMAESGELPAEIREHPAFDPNFPGNTLYDVWHKPTIKPSALTQKDTAAFLETGDYCGQHFEVEVTAPDDADCTAPSAITVDGVPASFEVGKSGKLVVRETPAMFAARLLEDIQKRPEFYYQRREIPRSKKELQRFRHELFHVYQAQRHFDRAGCWFENESQCRATFKCQYVPICYGPGADEVCDGKTTPPGFRRIFVDLTKDREAISEGE